MISIYSNPNRRGGSLGLIYPLLKLYKKEFTFFNDIDKLSSDKNKYLILVDCFDNTFSNSFIVALLTKFKNKYKKVIYLNGNDSPDISQSFILDFVDLYFKKQVYADFSNYSKPLKGARLFIDKYYRENVIGDVSFSSTCLPSNSLNKIKILWNLAYAPFPLSDYRRRFSFYAYKYSYPLLASAFLQKFTPLNFPSTKKLPFIQSRFSFNHYGPVFGYQRKVFLSLAEKNSALRTGYIPQSNYYNELSQSLGVLSPFGWGELCYRDFTCQPAQKLASGPA